MRKDNNLSRLGNFKTKKVLQVANILEFRFTVKESFHRVDYKERRAGNDYVINIDK